ncbi:MAG: hypothetical protein ISR58_03195 [Anaerolineales bacterium]|nr:hypothetical protein [Chloroflexota bacterium]MBL6980177.1 hypothetical protein [Anaerolineales bacterium]
MKNNIFLGIITLFILSACAMLPPPGEGVEQSDEYPPANQIVQEQENAEKDPVKQEMPESTATQQSTFQLPTATLVSEVSEVVTPVLSTELARGCERGGPGAQPPKDGQLAIDFTLLDVAENSYTLSELLSEKPVVLIFGSFT